MKKTSQPVTVWVDGYAVVIPPGYKLIRTKAATAEMIRLALSDPRTAGMSDRQLGKLLKVSKTVVGNYRRKVCGSG